MSIVKVRKVGNAEVITIPKSVIRELGLKTKDYVQIYVDENTMIVEKIEKWEVEKDEKYS